jgi:uridine kinase
MSRSSLLEEIARSIVRVDRPHPTRVAIDGVDAAGKTTLADALAPVLASLGRPVVRASIDSFHRPRAERYERGRDSPEGYYRDSFDPELSGRFDWSVFLDVPFEVTRGRAAQRDGSPPEVDAPANRRYVEGQRLYLRECDPWHRASAVVDDTDPSAPRLVPMEESDG